MQFGTLCSGIEGAAVAFRDFGWTHTYCAEVDGFCCDLLAHHYPETPNLGDITEATTFPSVDVIVAGTPCQSFSRAGKREGLADPRGQLALRFIEIIRQSQPEFLIWENVPGVLSSNRGQDFAAFIGELADSGYGLAWRVLDARFFGVAQRRRRVFVVASRSGYEAAAAVILEAPACSADVGPIGEVGTEPQSIGRATTPVLGFSGDTTPKFGADVTPTLRSQWGGEGFGILSDTEFRRLAVEEWEQLQGFPVGYTAIGKWGETVRRRALGNAFAVPVIRWLGERLAFVAENCLTLAA